MLVFTVSDHYLTEARHVLHEDRHRTPESEPHPHSAAHRRGFRPAGLLLGRRLGLRRLRLSRRRRLARRRRTPLPLTPSLNVDRNRPLAAWLAAAGIALIALIALTLCGCCDVGDVLEDNGDYRGAT